ncbi:MAG: hypothetical protein BroJett040_17050 [Oligoflexia bacterium]|nr:MAG: hypothetical protein BroJett040_17050 [Oligoflexia bacterium]
MLHFKILLLSFFVCSLSLAAETVSQTQSLPKSKIDFSYVSWSEVLKLEDGTTKDQATNQFFGNALTYQYDFSSRQASGFLVETGILFGKANAGGSQAGITYQTSNNPWSGALLAGAYRWNLSPSTYLSLVPTLLYRKVTMQAPNASTTQFKLAPDINQALIIEARALLTPKLSFKYQMGSLVTQANAWWGFGLGYAL